MESKLVAALTICSIRNLPSNKLSPSAEKGRHFARSSIDEARGETSRRFISYVPGLVFMLSSKFIRRERPSGPSQCIGPGNSKSSDEAMSTKR